jgi:hypothetical protein
MSALATSRGTARETTMHLDCYDRSILLFVVNRDPRELPERECHGWFGISTTAVMRRFNAIVNVYASTRVPLVDADQELLDRASKLRS